MKMAKSLKKPFLEKILDKLNAPIRTTLSAALVFSPFALYNLNNTKAEINELRFKAGIYNDDPNNPVVNDTFYARWDNGNKDTNITDDYDFFIQKGQNFPPDIVQPPLIPGKQMQLYTIIDTNTKLTQESKDTAYWNIHFLVNSKVSGTQKLELIDPNELVPLKHYNTSLTHNDTIYDLKDPNNYSLEWPVNDVIGIYDNIEFIITPKSDFNKDGKINITDLSYLVNSFLSDDPNKTLITDINQDNITNLNDFAILNMNWLYPYK